MSVWNCKCRNRRNHEILSEKLSDHEKEVEIKIDNTQRDIVSLRQEMSVNNLCLLEESLEAKSSRQGKFESRLMQFSRQVTSLHST
jgi:hypothetical protein